MALSEEIELPAGEVRPVRLSPPLNESEMKRIIFCSADICTLDTEKDNMLIRPVLSGDLTPDEQGQWAEVFCGLTVKAGEVLLGTRNMRKSENQWLLNSNPVSFYRDRESYDSPDPSLSRGTDGSAKIHVEIREGKPVLISQSVEMRNLYSDVRWNRFEDRTNYPLEEIGLAVVDCTTYESLDWSAERVLKREQFEFLPLGESISFSLIPLESLGSPLCIRYRVKLEDKSLIYLLTDYETGRLLKREKYRQ